MAKKKEEIYVQSGRTFNKETFEAHRKYQNDFMKETYKTVSMKFGKVKDAAILAKFEEVDNATEYVRQLINKDLKKENKKKK